MTYQNMQMMSQQPSALPQYQPVTGAARSVFQPGFAGTNVQEVRALNVGYPAPAAFGPYSGQAYATHQQPTAYGMNPALGGSVSAIFQPGFAGTNAQEVRHDYALSQQSTIPAYGRPYQAGVSAIGAPVSAAPISAIFQPGFAGTNAQEVRQDFALSQQGTMPTLAHTAPTAMGMTAGSIFQPGFAGTNVQEVRALNAGYPAPAAYGPYTGQAYATQQQPTAYGMNPALGGSTSAIFQPGFAGTNAQEVRQDYTLSQQSAQPPYGYAVPGRPV